MLGLVLIIFLTLTNVQIKPQESAQYLQDAIRELKIYKNTQNIRRGMNEEINSPSVVTTKSLQIVNPLNSERRIQNKNKISDSNIPPLTLTKGELAAIYEAAVQKGDTVQLNTDDNNIIHAAVHEIDNHPEHDHSHDDAYIHEHDQKHSHDISHNNHEYGMYHHDDGGGYYYYYYPIKGFLNEIISHPTSSTSSLTSHDHYKPYRPPTPSTSTIKPRVNIHSHTHQHNVKITPVQLVEKKKEKKALEPLFMAISGFIGMALMFFLSIVLLPKFGNKKSINNKKKQDHINEIARVALQAIEGKGCAERFACELGKTARAFHLHDNRFIKLFHRLAPSSFIRYLDQYGKYPNRKIKCTLIPCKKKPSPPHKNSNNRNSHNNNKNKNLNNNNNNNNKNKKKNHIGIVKKPQQLPKL